MNLHKFFKYKGWAGCYGNDTFKDHLAGPCGVGCFLYGETWRLKSMDGVGGKLSV